MEKKLKFILIEVKAIDWVEFLMDEQEKNIMVRLEAENNTFQRFGIDGVGCYFHKDQ